MPIHQSAIPNPQSIEVDCVSLGGLSLMERLTGAERVILIDSIFTGKKPVGTVSQFTLSDLPDLTAGHSASAHDTSLRNALNVGRSMHIHLPEDGNVIIIAIEAESVYDFSQELSPAVAEAVPQAVKIVLDLLDKPEIIRRETWFPLNFYAVILFLHRSMSNSSKQSP